MYTLWEGEKSSRRGNQKSKQRKLKWAERDTISNKLKSENQMKKKTTKNEISKLQAKNALIREAEAWKAWTKREQNWA